MVMHARKYPRHNDGYYDRNQTHPFEEKYPSKSNSSGSGGSYYDRYGERSSKDAPSSYSRIRDDSPGRPNPRYQNKSSYKERAKERIDKGANNSPGDSRLNHYHNSRSEVDRHQSSSSNKPAFKSLESLKAAEPKDAKTEQIQKSALRVSGEWSEHRSSSGKKYYYNCVSEVSQWEKPKDWIELSANLGRPIDNSSGSGRPKDRNGRDARNAMPTSTITSDDRYKHSSGGGGGGISGNHRGSGMYPTSSSASASTASASYAPSSSGGYSHSSPAASGPDHHRHSQTPHRDGEQRERSDLRKAWSVPSERYGEYVHPRGDGGGSHQSHGTISSRDRDSGSGLQRIPVVCRSSSLPDGPNHERGGGSGGGGGALHRQRGGSSRSDEHHQPHYQQHHHRSENHLHPHHHHHHKLSPAAAFNGARHHHGDHLPRNENEDSRQTEDMDISPGSTPTSSRPNSHMGTPLPNNSSVPMTQSMPGANMGNDFTQQAIQTLQKLQAALIAQQHQIQQQHLTNTSTTVSQSPRSASDATPPHQPQYASPHYNNQQGTPRLNHQLSHIEEDSRESRESPRSDRSVRSSRRGSPTPSVASSQSVSLSGSSLSAANKKQDAVQLTPSLSNYYNDALIEHCANLQADQAERQANRYGEEAHSVGTLHCTQVSVDLKRARSLVRIAEIQATLQEQRILFLRQQTRDLENMRSQNSFMPSQQDT